MFNVTWKKKKKSSLLILIRSFPTPQFRASCGQNPVLYLNSTLLAAQSRVHVQKGFFYSIWPVLEYHQNYQELPVKLKFACNGQSHSPTQTIASKDQSFYIYMQNKSAS